MEREMIVCAFCQDSQQDLRRLNNRDHLEVLREKIRTLRRTSLFCTLCRHRVEVKFNTRQRNAEIRARKAARKAARLAATNRTGTYTNASTNPDLNFASRDSNNGSADDGFVDHAPGYDIPEGLIEGFPDISDEDEYQDEGPQNQSSHSSNRENQSNRSNRSNHSSQHSATTSGNRRQSDNDGSQQSVGSKSPPVNYDYNDDDDDADAGTPNDNSFHGHSLAPATRNPSQRTRSLSDMPPQDVMRSLDGQGRAQVFATFNRGHAG
ncbi:uncharacterized protein LOC116341606 [Contarinia nasturtii]|uniref:uncharacterized protein LOC116341606 n=1 Tax=Contarinia nasturtii TaxID=265458 RepID=UPI0012D3B993|nr:uncharacterized protein LOC116341606 [Contarinia nasturtii]